MIDLDKLIKHLGSEPASIFPGEDPTIVFAGKVANLRDFIMEIVPKVPFDDFIKNFIAIASTHGRKINPKGDAKTRRQFSARVAEGYTMDDFIKAIRSLHLDSFHKEKNWYYADPEFVTRAGNMEKLLQRYDILVGTDTDDAAILKMKEVYEKWVPDGKQDPDKDSDHNKYWREQWVMAGTTLKSLYAKSSNQLMFIARVGELLKGTDILDNVIKGLNK